MFQENLLESSSKKGRRKHWPMATAFLLETAAAAAIVAVPLLSTGVIPVLARVEGPTLPVPLTSARPKPIPTGTGSGGGSARPAVVAITTCNSANCIHIGRPVQPAEPNQPPSLIRDGSDYAGLELVTDNDRPRPSGPGPGRFRLSNPSEAQLVTRVEPIYPHIAKVSGIAGTVKLHAIIGKDGSIQSLSVISGHPILAAAALAAVEKWRYRPYLLNGEAVEVETFVTVNFRKAGQ
ncbi:MAG TPA: TonB family protein [Candidatus Angelobacter sp.]